VPSLAKDMAVKKGTAATTAAPKTTAVERLMKGQTVPAAPRTSGKPVATPSTWTMGQELQFAFDAVDLAKENEKRGPAAAEAGSGAEASAPGTLAALAASGSGASASPLTLQDLDEALSGSSPGAAPATSMDPAAAKAPEVPAPAVETPAPVASVALALVPTVSDTDVVMCYICKEPVSSAKTDTVCRCKKCNACMSRLNRIMTQRSEFVEDWGNQSDEQRQAFYMENRNKYGKDLEGAVHIIMTETRMKKITHKFNGSGKWYDEADMRERYKNKPDQLSAVLNNCAKMFCPKRETTLHEYVDYTTLMSVEEEYVKEQKRKYETTKEFKAEKNRSPLNPRLSKRLAT